MCFIHAQAGLGRLTLDGFSRKRCCALYAHPMVSMRIHAAIDHTPLQNLFIISGKVFARPINNFWLQSAVRVALFDKYREGVEITEENRLNL